MKAGEFLQQQAKMLEMHKFSVEASSMEAQKRNKILDNQRSVIDFMEKMADKVIVNNQLAAKNAEKQVKEENKGWNLANVSGNEDGFMFL